MKYAIEKYEKIVLIKSRNLNAERFYLRTKSDFDFIYVVDRTIDSNDLCREFYETKLIGFNAFLDMDFDDNVKFVIFEEDVDELQRLLEQLEKKGYLFLSRVFPWDLVLEPYKVSIDKYLAKYGDYFWKNFPSYIRKQNRRTILVNGNCQTGLIKDFLTHNIVIREKYLLLDIPPIHVYSIGNEETIIGWADIIISQIISDNNRHNVKLSSNAIDRTKKESARLIKIAPLNITYYFPQFSSDCPCIKIGNKPAVSYGDANINELSKTKSVNEIINIISDDYYYSDDFLEEHCKTQLELFKTKEFDADVKMFDWLEENMPKRILFYSYNHPHPEVIKELTTRILLYIGIRNNSFIDEDNIFAKNRMDLQEQIIYPSVYRFLGISETNRVVRPNSLATGFILDFDDYVRFYISSLAEKHCIIPQKRNIAIWGSCVTREIFNYTDFANIDTYILQNPIHTFRAKPYIIDDSKLVGTSNFTERMLKIECKKTVLDILKNSKADYLLIDTADCRNDWYQLRDDSDVKIVQSLSLDKTFSENVEMAELFERKSVFSISKDEWKHYVKDFCEEIKKLFPEDHIVLNEFNFCTTYLKDGEIIQFEYSDFYKKQNEVTNYVAALIKENMPNIKVISAPPFAIANYYHHIGNSSLHYIDELYVAQAKKLEKIII